MFLALFAFFIAFQQIFAASNIQGSSSEHNILPKDSDKKNLLPTEASTPLELSSTGPSCLSSFVTEASRKVVAEDQDKIANCEKFEKAFHAYRKAAKRLKEIEDKLSLVEDTDVPALADRHRHLSEFLFKATMCLLATHRAKGLCDLKKHFEMKARRTKSKLTNYDDTEYEGGGTLDLSRMARLNALNVKTVLILDFILHLLCWVQMIVVKGKVVFQKEWEPFFK